MSAAMPEADALIVFTPSGKRGRFPVGTPVLQAARALGVDIDSVCGGRGLCGRCQVLVAEGEFAKHGVSSSAASLTPVSEPERSMWIVSMCMSQTPRRLFLQEFRWIR